MREKELYRCPCCKCHTLASRRRFDICTLCWWEDDGQDDPHADEVWGGPNGDYSLTEGRNNVAEYGIKYRPTDQRFAQRRHPILGPNGEYAIDRVALRARAYIEFRQFGADKDERAEIIRRLRHLLEAIHAADMLYRS
jgi:hypothetical protein